MPNITIIATRVCSMCQYFTWRVSIFPSNSVFKIVFKTFSKSIIFFKTFSKSFFGVNNRGKLCCMLL